MRGGEARRAEDMHPSLCPHVHRARLRAQDE